MSPRLPRELLGAVAAALWADVEEGDTGDTRDEVADAAFVALSCACRQLSELCAPLRWSAVEVRSSRSIAAVEMILMRPHLLRHVRELTIWIGVGPYSYTGPSYTPDDVDILIALISVVDRLDCCCLSILPHHPADEDSDEDIASATAAFERMFAALARRPRPGLRALHLEGEIGDHVASVSASALGAIAFNAPELTICKLLGLRLVGPTLGPVATASMPRLVDFAGCSLHCADGVARELGACVGAHTQDLSTCGTAWSAQHAFLSAVRFDTPLTVSNRWRWTVGETAHDLSGSVAALLSERDIEGLEAICTDNPGGLALLHHSAATARTFYLGSHTSADDVADRLADPSYGRFLQRILIRHGMRSARLDEVCKRRNITVTYPCVASD